jgi:hypothetical protein
MWRLTAWWGIGMLKRLALIGAAACLWGSAIDMHAAHHHTRSGVPIKPDPEREWLPENELNNRGVRAQYRASALAVAAALLFIYGMVP